MQNNQMGRYHRFNPGTGPSYVHSSLMGGGRPTTYDGGPDHSTSIPRDILLESEDRQDVYEVQSVCLHN